MRGSIGSNAGRRAAALVAATVVMILGLGAAPAAAATQPPGNLYAGAVSCQKSYGRTAITISQDAWAQGRWHRDYYGNRGEYVRLTATLFRWNGRAWVKVLDRSGYPYAFSVTGEQEWRSTVIFLSSGGYYYSMTMPDNGYYGWWLHAEWSPFSSRSYASWGGWLGGYCGG